MTEFSIVLVDDSLADAMLFAEAVKQTAHSIPLTRFEDGQSALDYLRDKRTVLPDLVLLDLNMPGLSGHDVLYEIRSDRRLKRVPVIVLTSSSNMDDVARSYDEHANAYVVKPNGFAGFVDVVNGLAKFWFTVVTMPRTPDVD